MPYLFINKDPDVFFGTVAHAVGTAKSLHMGDEVAAMATLGLCVNGIFTAIILPLLFSFLSPSL